MRKSPEKKSEDRLWGFVNADHSEWQRLIEDPEFITEIKRVQISFGLPIDTHGLNHPAAKEIVEWMGWDEPIQVNETKGELILGVKTKRRNRLEQQTRELAEHFNIPDKFYSSLHRFILTNSPILEIASAGFPSFTVSKNKKGEFTVFECIITPETDLDNPVVMSVIRHWQNQNRDKLPEPLPMRNNTKRLDWSPVWEWRKRHPDVSLEEIAQRLHRNPVTVRRALANLEKSNLLQK